MSNQITIVGSGASGVHFALTLLEKGHRVRMIDVGNSAPRPANPKDDLNALKANLDDPVQYFLGTNYEALILPAGGKEYYGFPPSKDYVFQQPTSFTYRTRGFAPILSFAKGGLAEVWTGGCYPFTDGELQAFPFGYKEIAPYYNEVAKRIGISGAVDDLARFFPVHDHLLPPLELDQHSALLLDKYERGKSRFNSHLNCYIGRARIATLSKSLRDRQACDYLGRCLWGCPHESLYTPSVTLRQCREYSNFDYVGGLYVSHFRFTSGGRITKLVARSVENGLHEEFEVDKLVLAAGTLCSSKIFLSSIQQDGGERIELKGLTDNRQVLMPFVNLRMIGRPYNPKSYQYHQLAIGVERSEAFDYVHGLVTTLKTALVHPVIQNLPFDLGTAVSMFRDIRAGLGLVNVNFSAQRRESNSVCLAADRNALDSPLFIQYRPPKGEAAGIKTSIRGFRKILRQLGCIAPSALTHVRPMGASVHYAGTIPMAEEGGALTCTPHCQSRDFENLYFVDGTTFPSLPAKNLTFTLMANAARVADHSF